MKYYELSHYLTFDDLALSDFESAPSPRPKFPNFISLLQPILLLHPHTKLTLSTN